MEIYLIRHTMVAIEPGICYGQTDIPVANSFETELKAVQKKLQSFERFSVYSSPLSRCRMLAERLCADHVRMDPRLMEMHFGSWEQQRWDDIEEEQFSAWMVDFVHQRCTTEGESYQEVFDRVVSFWDELNRKQSGDALIVTHGGVIRALLGYLLDIPLENTMRIGIDFGGVTKVRQYDYGPVVEYVNR